jgi:hypothetical protein
MSQYRVVRTGLERIDKNHLPVDEYNQLIKKGYMIIADDLTTPEVAEYQEKNKAGTKTIFLTDTGKRVETIITNCEVNLIFEGRYKGSLFVTIE